METSTETTDTGLSFAYDASGLRTEKTVVTKTYETVHTHDYTDTVIEPTCTEGGYTLHECDCGDSYQDNETDPLGHDYVESGVDTYTCTRCGSSYTTHTHSYTATVVEPTCTERGYTLYECACGHSYQSNFTNALDHDYVKVREDYQYYYYECTRCGKTYRSPIYHIPVEPKPPIAVAGLTPETETNGSQQVLVSTVTEEHSYIYAGGMLLRETITSGSTTKTLDFRYDNVGYPYALIYNNGSTTATYYYITNLQGDVMYLVDSNGNQVAAYTYDPYGKILSATGTMAEINPLRYRGYYYDTETGFYYLQSRYYDPNTCRFINADSYASTGQGLLGYNMFAYCLNSPCNYIDSNGQEAAAIILTGAAYQAFASWLAAIASANWWNAVGWVAAAVLVTGVITVAAVYLYEWYMEETGKGKETDPEPPDVTYPGDDPTKAPGDGYEWKGQEPVGGDKGSWVNPNTGEQFHPDLNHEPPIDPHYDYTDGTKPKIWWRVYRNGRIDLKN